MKRGLTLLSVVLFGSAVTTSVAQGARETPRLPPIRIVHRSTPLVTSLNWAGYASTGTTFKAVVGSWTEPLVNCAPASNGAAAFWVGLDGYNSSTVEQAGTIAICTNGHPTYYDWWEMYPKNAVQLVHTVSPGDQMRASVTYSSNSYTLKVTDSTHSSSSFTTTQTCSGTCRRSSADWIVEAPSSGGILPLPNFGQITFKSASATSNAGHTGPINDRAWTAHRITMVNGNNQVKASTSKLNSMGNGFTVKWVRAH